MSKHRLTIRDIASCAALWLGSVTYAWFTSPRHISIHACVSLILIVGYLIGLFCGRDTAVNQKDGKADRKQPPAHLLHLVHRYYSGRLPELSPAEAKKDHSKKSFRYTNDVGIFWVTFACLFVMIVTTYYTREQAEVARVSATIQQRAYLDIEFIDLECSKCKRADPFNRTRSPYSDGFTFRIVNVGQVPAYEVDTCVKWVTFEPDFKPIDFSFTCKRLDNVLTANPKYSSFIAPTKNVIVTVPVAAEAVDNVRAKEAVLYVYGHITFASALGEKQILPFCRIYGAIGKHQALAECPQYKTYDH